VQKWIDFFVLNKPVYPEIINQKVKKQWTPLLLPISKSPAHFI
jgi:hypothetical protein